MKKRNFIFTLFLSLFLFNQSFASFPITKDIKEKTDKLENVKLTETNNLVGAEFDAPTPPPPPPPANTTALIVCLFFGVLGIHRFVMGDVGIGLLQLLTFGGLGIWTLIDFIRLCTGDLG